MKDKCLIKDCGKKSLTRGLCRDHYQIAVITIRKGETTWDELMKLGMATETHRPERGKKRKAFDSMLTEKRK